MNDVKELIWSYRDAVMEYESIKYSENDKWKVICLFYVFPGSYSIYIVNKETAKIAGIDNLSEYESHRIYDEMCAIHGLD